MNLEKVFHRRQWQAIVKADGLHESEAIKLRDDETVTITDATVAWVKKASIPAVGKNAALNLATGLLSTTTPPTYQVETLTVVAAAGCTANGNLALTLTAAGMTGSPLAILVPLTTAVHTTASLIAAAIREKLNTLTAVTDLYTIGGAGATVTLTRKANLGNDGTLLLAITAGLGVSVANSANTTAGVLGTVLENAAAVDARGKALPTVTEIIFCQIRNTGAGDVIVSGWAGVGEDITLRKDMELIRRAELGVPTLDFNWGGAGIPVVEIVLIGK